MWANEYAPCTYYPYVPNGGPGISENLVVFHVAARETVMVVVVRGVGEIVQLVVVVVPQHVPDSADTIGRSSGQDKAAIHFGDGGRGMSARLWHVLPPYPIFLCHVPFVVLCIVAAEFVFATLPRQKVMPFHSSLVNGRD